MNKTVFFLTAALAVHAAAAKDIVAENAYARATVGQPQSGAFLTLKNTGKTDHALVSASVGADVAQTVELHTHVNDQGVMRMVEVKEGIAVKAGETVELKPGGYHVMFYGLKKDLRPGQTFPMTLTFKNGERETVQVSVRELGRAAGKEGHGHHHHNHAPQAVPHRH